MRIAKIKVYKYNELSETVKTKIINNTINFFLELPYENLSEKMKKAVDKAESLYTPWFSGSYIWEYARDEIITQMMSICNRYLEGIS